ncbi:MAG: DUF368 domain-containing protein [Clostridia bacterium]|nr:DUF368 domain-containing protein [Clostridia bacterium]
MNKFVKNLLCGAGMGVAIIVPGMSGGSVAAITRIYEGIIESISNLFKDFKKSFMFLLPVIIGVVAGLVIVFFPIRLALQYAPFPTMMLFAGLIIGTLPFQFKDGLHAGFKPQYIASILIPMAVIIGIGFIPGMGSADLSMDMPTWQYVAVFAIGILVAAAFMVPGISGSMILFILGYYSPILDLFTGAQGTAGHCILVLVILLVGALIGIFCVARLMKVFLNRFPKGSYWAITGFIVGSIVTMFVVFPSDYPDAVYDTMQISCAVALIVVGLVGGFLLTFYASKWQDKPLLPAKKAKLEQMKAKMDGTVHDVESTPDGPAAELPAEKKKHAAHHTK